MLVAGSVIFGGGPVVIPLLRDYVVVPGWVSSRDFLLIYAILTSFPGPNFNFSAALGVLALPSAPVAGAFLAYFGIFAPGIILKLALLPWYGKLKEKVIARSTLRGLNAAASGLVFAAVFQLYLVGFIYRSAAEGNTDGLVSAPLSGEPFWMVVLSGAFLASRSFGSPPWLTVIGGGVAGLAWYGAVGRHRAVA